MRRWTCVLSISLALVLVSLPLVSMAMGSLAASPWGDVNGDGLVDLFDLVAVALRMGTLAAPGTPEDMNRNGWVDVFDLVAVAANLAPPTLVTPVATSVLPSPTPVTATPTATPAQPPSTGRLVYAQVVEVVDGDTIRVLINGVSYSVRYIGINAPETKHPQVPVQPFGPEAAAKNQQLVGGKIVLLEKDMSEADTYGRLLRYVWVGDVMVNAELVRLGFAQVSTYPPAVKYQDSFLELQQGHEKLDGACGD